jgi:hypothetical protein
VRGEGIASFFPGMGVFWGCMDCIAGVPAATLVMLGGKAVHDGRQCRRRESIPM